ncbi:MAG: acyltransferase [Pseudomonadota bacterium]
MNFLNYINTFRALAIFCIVGVHTQHVFSWGDSAAQGTLLHILLGNSTIFFIFISGYLFQHLSSKFNIKRYYFSKAKYVLLPYLIISLPAVLYFVFISPKEFLQPSFFLQSIWMQIFYYYWWGLHLSPMWFVPVILLYYLLAPLLVIGDRTKVLYWLLPIFILVSLIVPRGLTPNNFLHFFSVYVIGMFFSKYRASLNVKLVKSYIIFILFTIFISLFLAEYLDIANNIKGINYLQKIVLTFLILGLLIKFESKTSSTFITVVANTSFGVFFVHAYIIGVFKQLSNYINQQFLTYEFSHMSGTLVTHFLTSAAVLFLSILVVLLIKRMLGSNTYLLIGNIPSAQPQHKSQDIRMIKKYYENSRN